MDKINHRRKTERPEALAYFVRLLHEGKLEYRNGEIWRLWELRRNWLVSPRRAEKQTTNGYYTLRVTDKSIGYPLYVMAHRVIWAFFNDSIPSGMTINHKNGIKTDNRIENLELVTQKENNAHARRIGLVKNQSEFQISRCKLSNTDAEKIRELLAIGKYSHLEIANMFGVRRNHISRIKNNKRRVVL